MKYIVKNWGEATEEDKLEYQQRCVKFWDKLEILCREEGIIPYPHYRQPDITFQMEAFTEGSWNQLRNSMWLAAYMYGVTVGVKEPENKPLCSSGCFVNVSSDKK
jgi:hypothetical protein